MSSSKPTRWLPPLIALAALVAPPTHGLRLSEVETLVVPPVDHEALLAEDAAAAGPGVPVRFAVALPVQVDPTSHGSWEDQGTHSVWLLRIQSPGALSLSLGFSAYRLPEGASLTVLASNGRTSRGPFTAADNEAHGELWTPLLETDDIVVRMSVPRNADWELRLASVNHGYRRFGEFPEGSGDCNVDVICPEGDLWRDQIRSAAAISLGGGIFCSGFLVNNTAIDGTPYFMTADHCGINSGNAASLVAYWNYENSTCRPVGSSGGPGDGSLSQFNTGAFFRSAFSPSDFTLVELDDPVLPDALGYFAGWDRTSGDSSSAVGIHHPSGQEKRISFEDDPTTTTSYLGTSVPGDGTHIRVIDWDLGTTEGGSSGSALFNQDQRVVGQLHGGFAACGNDSSDWYGRFSVSWDGGGGSSSRLSDWLDPLGLGPMVIDGADPSPAVLYLAHLGDDQCAADPGNENGIWEPGETIEVAVDVVASGDFTNVVGTLSSLTPGVAILDGTATWPDLTSGVPATTDPPHFTIGLEEAIPCFDDIDLELEITATDGGPFNFAFADEVGASPTPEVPVTIPDDGGAGNPATSDLVVNQSDILTDVDVRVVIQHSWVGDLMVTLRSPTGTEVLLLDRPGVPGSTFGCGDNNMDVTFDDASGFDPEDHCAGTDPWYTGVTAPVASLAAFNCESMLGICTLIVSDHAGQDTGSIIDWELLSTPPPLGECTVCGSDDIIFTDGFESGDTSAWSSTVP